MAFDLVLILIGKWYINKCKSTENQIYFFEFLIILKNKVNIMTHVPLQEDLGVMETRHMAAILYYKIITLRSGYAMADT